MTLDVSSYNFELELAKFCMEGISDVLRHLPCSSLDASLGEYMSILERCSRDRLCPMVEDLLGRFNEHNNVLVHLRRLKVKLIRSSNRKITLPAYVITKSKTIRSSFYIQLEVHSSFEYGTYIINKVSHYEFPLWLDVNYAFNAKRDVMKALSYISKKVNGSKVSNVSLVKELFEDKIMDIRKRYGSKGVVVIPYVHYYMKKISDLNSTKKVLLIVILRRIEIKFLHGYIYDAREHKLVEKPLRLMFLGRRVYYIMLYIFSD